MKDNPKTSQELPAGVSDFAKFLENNYFYADKTRHLYNLVKKEGLHFLARPRLFGKTLLANTLEKTLLGRWDFFEGLWIAGSDCDWTPHPAIRLNMLEAAAPNLCEIEGRLEDMAESAGEDEGIDAKARPIYKMLGQLTDGVFKKRGRLAKAALIIHNYDAPVVEFRKNPAMAEAAKKILGLFCGELKTRSEKIGHIFVYGLRRFAAGSFCTSLDSLRDLTFSPHFADICGFTQKDADTLLELCQDRALSIFA